MVRKISGLLCCLCVFGISLSDSAISADSVSKIIIKIFNAFFRHVYILTYIYL